MDNYNCDQLKNIDIPEGWIENALNIPSKNYKPAAPVKLYRFAAGIAACVVIAVAVMFSTLFGINKNVNLTAPQPDPSQADNISGGTSSDTTDGTISPSGIPPALFGAESQNPTVVTEPSENSGNNGNSGNSASKSKQQATISSNGSTKPSSKNSEKTNNGSGSGQGEPVPGESEYVTEEPATAEPWFQPPIEDPTEYWPEPWEPETQEPWLVEPTALEPEYREREFNFSIYAKLASEDDVVYCKVTDKDGNVVSNGLANIKFYEVYSLVSYTTYQKAAVDDPFTVCFYRADGGVYTTQTIKTRAINNFAFGYYIKAKY